ncbi:hypothetical protein NLG97_g4751 [Lecanicillium saksenae]|uniref:Uncharacterized protein n=1 Tax=Lecanicillium saksenae TaxID=468837 RepID=A0ACC1QUD9_9HYPO|nr:hypothetical protein NLG97_g4751 [Lecanicillium saksenae]
MPYRLMHVRVEYWDPQSLGYKFFAEARRLWDMERIEPRSVTTVQAGMVMNITYNVYSMDKVGLSYGFQAAAMAYEIGLFKPANGVIEPDVHTVRDYTAWCLYFCIKWVVLFGTFLEDSSVFISVSSFQCYLLMKPSPVQHEPAAALPDPDANPGWYGEFLLQYPSNPTLIPMHYPQWTRFKFSILSIVRPVSRELYDTEERSDAATRRQLYTRVFDELKILYARLPPQLSPAQVVLPLHMTIHLWYHNIMMSVGQLLIPEIGESSASSLRQAVESQLSRSKISFETIMRLYYLRNGYADGNILLLHCLAILSFMTLGEIQAPAALAAPPEDTRSTIILAAKGLFDLGKNYFISATIFRVLQGQMAPEDVGILSQYCGSGSEPPTVQDAHVAHVKAQYPLTIVSMTNVPERHRLENMIKDLMELAVEQTS